MRLTPEEKLLGIIGENDVQKLDGFFLDYPYTPVKRAFVLAGKLGSIEILEKLKKRPVELDSSTQNKSFYAAVENNHFNVVEWFCENGLTERQLYVALRTSVESGHIKMVEYFNKMDVLKSPISFSDIITIAIENGNTQIFESLLNRFLTSEMEKTDKKFVFIIQSISKVIYKKQDVNFLDLFLKNVSVDIKNSEFLKYVKKCEMEILQKYMEYVKDKSTINEAYLIVVKSKDTKKIEFLNNFNISDEIKKECSVDLVSLGLMKNTNSVDMMESSSDEEKLKCLKKSAAVGNLPQIKILLGKGEKDLKKIATILKIAIKNNQYQIVEYFFAFDLGWVFFDKIINFAENKNKKMYEYMLFLDKEKKIKKGFFNQNQIQKGIV